MDWEKRGAGAGASSSETSREIKVRKFSFGMLLQGAWERSLFYRVRVYLTETAMEASSVVSIM